MTREESADGYEQSPQEYFMSRTKEQQFSRGLHHYTTSQDIKGPEDPIMPAFPSLGCVQDLGLVCPFGWLEMHCGPRALW
jgi:hypothetical protein